MRTKLESAAKVARRESWGEAASFRRGGAGTRVCVLPDRGGEGGGTA
jgi:hypothetical protein